MHPRPLICTHRHKFYQYMISFPLRGRSLMEKRKSSKLMTRVRFPPSAPFFISDAVNLPGWRNWYTHMAQNHADIFPCGFDSRFRHHLCRRKPLRTRYSNRYSPIPYEGRGLVPLLTYKHVEIPQELRKFRPAARVYGLNAGTPAREGV